MKTKKSIEWYLERGEVPDTDLYRLEKNEKVSDRLNTFTYAVAAPDVARVKVGRTADWETRWRRLSYMSPVPLVMLAKAQGDYERELHALLLDFHSHGEWFVLCLESRAIIASRLEADGTPVEVAGSSVMALRLRILAGPHQDREGWVRKEFVRPARR